MSTERLRLVPLPYHRDSAPWAARLADRPWCVFLDSCVARGSSGRYDVIAIEPTVTLVTTGETTVISRDSVTEYSTEDPFALVAAAVAELQPVVSNLPFTGGALGYFGYDLGRRIERLPHIARRDIELPDMAIGIYTRAIVVDHDERSANLVVHPQDHGDDAGLLAAWTGQSPVTPPAFTTSFTVTSQVQPEINFAQYADGWQRIKRYLFDGDVYQVNLTQRFSATAHGAPWDAYLRLRNLNPAPFSAYFAAPGGTILSSSPERFLHIANGLVETKPIKGTRRRGATLGEDRALAEELAASDKDRAENVMIVDLLRNDLSKCCTTGSVRVTALCAVESFTKVHHLVSTIQGRVAPRYSPLDVLRACFPGGSITGAPKVRAMQIIEELEPSRRGIYCGAIGYVSSNARMDTNIAIRTLLYAADRLYCWAGGGIVIDSELDLEYQECFAKASAMLEVFANAAVFDLGR